jgi:hypothetical protein
MPFSAPTLVALVIAVVAGAAINHANARLKARTGRHTTDLQTRPSAAAIRTVTDVWREGDAQVGVWIGLAFGVDALLIAAYGCFFELALRDVGVTAPWMLALPLGAAAGDVCEDLLELRMILAEPSPLIATASFTATSVKWLLLIASLATLLYAWFAGHPAR